MAYADYLAIIVQTRTAMETELYADKTLAVVSNWMTRCGLELASEKSRIIFLVG